MRQESQYRSGYVTARIIFDLAPATNIFGKTPTLGVFSVIRKTLRGEVGVELEESLRWVIDSLIITLFNSRTTYFYELTTELQYTTRT